MRTALKRLLLACGVIAFLAGVLAYQTLTFRANLDVFEASVARLPAGERVRVDELVAAVTRGLARNEEGGVVYYHGRAITGERNRVFLLWQIVPAGTPLHRSLAAAVRGGGEVPRDGDLAMVAYVDLGFHSFRTRYRMRLGRMFDDRGLRGVKGLCYEWRDGAACWRRIGAVGNEDMLRLVSDEERREMRRGTYNRVRVVSVERAE